MIRITLDDAARRELQALRRSEPAPKARERIEMVTLSDAGWSAPRIAAHLGRNPQTVRDALRAYLARGDAALRPFRSGPAPDLDRRGRIESSLRELLAEDRAWTSRQLAEALARRGIALGPRQVRRHLRRIGSRYRRTASTLKHKQDPEKAARAGRPRSPPIGPRRMAVAQARRDVASSPRYPLEEMLRMQQEDVSCRPCRSWPCSTR